MTQARAGTCEASGAIAPAVYVNYFEVGHNPFEFLIDLGQFHPAADRDGRIGIHTRVAIAPPYAKMLADLLVRAVKEHEGDHGPIAQVGHHASPFDVVLSSLGEFEDRARELRARDRGGGDEADRSPRPSRSRTDR